MSQKSRHQKRIERNDRREQKRGQQRNAQVSGKVDQSLDVEFKHTLAKKERKPLEAKTHNQSVYISSIMHNTLTFGLGPAGTGKTFVAAALACELLEAGEIDKIIITRPAELCEEDFGALPGDLDEKYAPYLMPFLDAFNKQLGHGKTEYLIKRKVIEAIPLGFMRGITFDNAFVILDEAQNTSPKQMEMFLTRLGEICKVVVNGDAAQSDIQGVCGLTDAVNRMEGADDVAVMEFEESDCVRHGLVREVLRRYRK